MEATPSGKVVVLIEPLESNTSIGSVNVDAKRQTLSFMMLVKDNNPDFASWTDAEPLTVVLDPTLVTEITLQGKEIKSEGNITILIPDL